MKIANKIKQMVFTLFLLVWLTGCDKNIVDFGYDGAISGKLKDQAGNIVSGDITSTGLIVKALGEGDNVTMDMRVQGDGSFQNTKLYPKKFKIWISGPVTMTADTLRVDFSSDKNIQYDFVVVPFLTVKLPVISGSPAATQVTVSYEITGNNGKVPNLREVYCSTVPFPNTSTGSGPYFQTNKAVVNADSGNATVTGLTSKTKYFLRVGARATGTTAFNYSEQIVFTTP